MEWMKKRTKEGKEEYGVDEEKKINSWTSCPKEHESSIRQEYLKGRNYS